MKTLNNPIIKTLFLLIVLTVPATLVEGKKETTSTVSDMSSASRYNSVDAIRKIITYTISAKPVYTRTAEAENLMKAIAEKNASILRAIAAKIELKKVINVADNIYEEMELADAGLSQKAFEYAWRGYSKLQKRGLLHNTGVLSICDFSQSSSQERMYVIDVRSRKLLYRTFVAHGINSGEEYANSFSNSPESCKSSLGFYITQRTYTGINGLSLRIQGMDKGFNDHANERAIVIHGASYVSERILHKYGVMGTTFGCPAIPSELSSEIIPLVKNGSCFFIYYPSKKYLSESPVLNNL